MGVLPGNRPPSQAQHFAAGIEEKIDAFRVTAMAVFYEHRTGPEGEQLLRLRAHLALVAGRCGFEQHREPPADWASRRRACDQFAQPAKHVAAQQFFADVAMMTGSGARHCAAGSGRARAITMSMVAASWRACRS